MPCAFFTDAYEAYRWRNYAAAWDLLRLCLDRNPDHAGAQALLQQVERRLAGQSVTPPVQAVPQLEKTQPAPTDLVQAAIQRAQDFTGPRNRDWEPFVTTFSDLKIPDIPFCLVPVGAFQMGSADGYYGDEQPVHGQRIDRPYWIAQTPVTNAHWRLAVQAGVVPPPDGANARQWYDDPMMADAPVVGVDWFRARVFAAWLDCCLPGEVAWAYAARGVESLRYPWGDDWDPDRLVWGGNSGGQPAGVTSQPAGESWVAARHMVGNVWEWTNSLFEPYPLVAPAGWDQAVRNSRDLWRVLRGGSWWFDDARVQRSACRSLVTPDEWDDNRGLRLARSC